MKNTLSISTENSLLHLKLSLSDHSKNISTNLKLLWDKRKITDVSIYNNSSTIFYILLTENNLKQIVELILPYNFNINPEILSCYNIIKSWDEQNIKTKLQNDILEKSHKLNDIDLSNMNIINDRSIRYQYSLTNNNYDKNNLTEKIANRVQSKIWIDSQLFTIDDVISSLIELKRTPILFIFNQYDTEPSLDFLKKITSSLGQHDINDIGVYFRLKNEGELQQFNEYIFVNKYNNLLTEHTQTAMIQDGKIPKFFLKTNWTPMSIVFLETELKQNKTLTYAMDKSDLILFYSKVHPTPLELIIEELKSLL